MSKRKKVKAKITRTVTEIAIVFIDSDGCIEEIDDICEEINSDNKEEGRK
jgi:hypothetical protein